MQIYQTISNPTTIIFFTDITFTDKLNTICYQINSGFPFVAINIKTSNPEYFIKILTLLFTQNNNINGWVISGKTVQCIIKKLDLIHSKFKNVPIILVPNLKSLLKKDFLEVQEKLNFFKNNNQSLIWQWKKTNNTMENFMLSSLSEIR